MTMIVFYISGGMQNIVVASRYYSVDISLILK